MNKLWKILSYRQDNRSNFVESLLAERGIKTKKEKEIYNISDAIRNRMEN